MATKTQVLEKLKPKNINFKVDSFEEIQLEDMIKFDESIRVKLNRNLTSLFNEWLIEKLEAKELVKINIKGEVRSGKSLIGLKILNTLTKFYPEKNFDTNLQVMANQKEYRKAVQNAIFGDSYLVDENAFSSVGVGSMSELQQLKDLMNITAKKNLHTIFITPRVFLDTGATLGLAYYGKDVKNWLSRFLLYSLKNGVPSLMGYVIFDVGVLFQDTGCLIYNEIGGCTNPKRKSLNQIKKENIKFSSCIKKDYKDTDLNHSLEQCPFYNICTSQMCNYEHKKDSWINRELKGGLSERDLDKMETATKLFKEFVEIDSETGQLRLKAKNGKELKIKIKMKIPLLTNTKYVGVEYEEIMTLITSMIDLDFLKDILKQLDINYNDYLKECNLI